MKKIGLLIVCVFMLVCLLVGALHVTKREEESPIENAGLAQNAAVEPESLLYNGEAYPIRAHLQTVLLIGTDSTEGYQEQTDGVKAFYNYHQADFLTLVVMDTQAGTAQYPPVEPGHHDGCALAGCAGELRRHGIQAAVPGL